jgi:hypothetical protein
MEKIYFDETTFIWKTKANFLESKDDMITKCLKIADDNIDKAIFDNYRYTNDIELNSFKTRELAIKIPLHTLDDIINLSLTNSIEVYEEKFNRITIEAWVNIVRAKKPKQRETANDSMKMHIHTELNYQLKSFKPTYTFVYYVQMPNNLSNLDGVLLIEGENKKIYNILPEEDDLIIFDATIPHTPKAAFNSTKDRIVLAGNIGFENIKEIKSLL